MIKNPARKMRGVSVIYLYLVAAGLALAAATNTTAFGLGWGWRLLALTGAAALVVLPFTVNPYSRAGTAALASFVITARIIQLVRTGEVSTIYTVTILWAAILAGVVGSITTDDRQR